MFDKDGGKAWAKRMKALGKTFETEESRGIARWMRAHAAEHIDPATGELNSTTLVEAWDRECSTGEATLDMDHEAWTVAALFTARGEWIR